MSPLSYSIDAAVAATGISRSNLYRAIKAGKLRAKKSGVTEDGEPAGRLVILASELSRWLESLEDA